MVDPEFTVVGGAEIKENKMLDSNNPIHDRRTGDVGTASEHVGVPAEHYHVLNRENPNFMGSPAGKWFDDKKAAKRHTDAHVDAGYTPQVTKYPAGDYSKGKPAFEARIQARRFFKGYS
jgi:hypothetical protein